MVFTSWIISILHCGNTAHAVSCFKIEDQYNVFGERTNKFLMEKAQNIPIRTVLGKEMWEGVSTTNIFKVRTP